MRKAKSILAVIFISGFLVFLCVPALTVDAQVRPISEQESKELEIAGGSDLRGYIRAIVNVFLSLVGIVASIFVIIGGIQYITAAGNTQQSETAKRTVLYAILGLIIIGLSAVIINFVIGAI